MEYSPHHPPASPPLPAPLQHFEQVARGAAPVKAVGAVKAVCAGCLLLASLPTSPPAGLLSKQKPHLRVRTGRPAALSLLGPCLFCSFFIVFSLSSFQDMVVFCFCFVLKKESLRLDINILGVPQHAGLKLNILPTVCMSTEILSVGLSEATRKCTMDLGEALDNPRRRKM